MNKQASRTRGAVIVTRVSTGDQDKKGTSPETQLEACRAKAAQLSIPIIEEYYDAAISGAFLLSRKGMQSALADIQMGRADTLICPNMSRYSRDEEHQAAIKKAVRAAGGRIVFCDIDLPDTPEGDLAFGLMGQFAAYERRVIRERTMKGRRQFAKNGVQTARGWSPYGYTLVKHADVIRGDFRPDQLGQYVIDEAEAEIVRWLFQAYATGEHSLPGLVRELNRRGVPTKQGASLWHPPTVRNFFNNEVYIGRPKFGKMTCRMDEGRLSQIRPLTGDPYRSAEVKRPSAPEDVIELSAPPLVDQATWDTVQQRLATNRSRRGGNPSRCHMLSGIVVCEHCGAAMVVSGSWKHPKGYPHYYQCGAYRQAKSYAGQENCVAEAYKVPVAEEAVVQSIEGAVSHPEWLAAAVEAYKQDSSIVPSDDARRELAAVDRALAGLAADEAAAVQGQIAGIRAGASPDAYATVFADLSLRRKDLEDRRGVLSRTVGSGGKTRRSAKPDTGEVIAQSLRDVSLALRSPHVTEQDKRLMVTRVVQKVHCHKDGASVFFTPGLFGEDTLQDVSVSFFR